MEVHFIDVGQGDAIFISCQGHYMLIDAGDNSKGSTVRYYMKKLGVSSLDYVIGTHPDADHIGGLDVVIENFDVKTILMPDAENDTITYRDVIDAIKWANNKITLPIVGKEYSLGTMTFTILSPGKKYSALNDMSIAVMLKHGSNKFLLTGDCELESEEDMLNGDIDLSADVFKLGHHGSRTSNPEAFLKAVSPTDVVISCGKTNSYGHPHKSVIDTVKEMGLNCYRTDEQGNLIAISDGNKISWNVEPSTTWMYRVYDPDSGAEDESSEIQGVKSQNDSDSSSKSYDCKYILNTNSMKFHVPGCSAVNQMSDNNKVQSDDDKDTLISKGYSPCGICNP